MDTHDDQPGGGIEAGETVLEAPMAGIRDECACESRVFARLGESTESVETRRSTRTEVQGSSFRAELIGDSTAGWQAPE